MYVLGYLKGNKLHECEILRVLQFFIIFARFCPRKKIFYTTKLQN